MTITVDGINLELDNIISKKYIFPRDCNIVITFLIDEFYINTDHIRILVELHRIISDTKKTTDVLIKEFRFELHNKIKNFDLTFIGMIYLFKISNPNSTLSINVSLDENQRPEENFYRISHFFTYSYRKNSGPIFDLYINNKFISFPFKMDGDLITEEIKIHLFEISGHFLPLFVFSEDENYDNYKILFSTNFEVLWLKFINLIRTDEDIFIYLNSIDEYSNESIYQKLKYFILEKSITSNQMTYQEAIFISHYLKYLRSLLLIKPLLKNLLKNRDLKLNRRLLEYLESKHTGISFSFKSFLEYEKEINDKLNDFIKKPVYHVLVSCLISYSVVNLTDKIKHNSSISDLIKLIFNIQNFSEEIFYSNKELVKNIKQHSTHKRGVLGIRVYTKELLTDLKPYVSYLEELKIPYQEFQELKTDYFLDIFIYDDGDDGIIEKGLENISKKAAFLKKKDDQYSKWFSEDIGYLKSTTNLFNKLYDAFYNTTHIKLNHQRIKAAASYGLLIFTNLLKKNMGTFAISTVSESKQAFGLKIFPQRSKTTIDYKVLNLKNGILPIGTFYSILIPIDLNKNYITHKTSFPSETATSESTYDRLFEYLMNVSKSKPLLKIIDFNGDFESLRKNNENDKYALVKSIYDKFIKKHLLSEKNNHESQIFALNLIELQNYLEASDLIHLLAFIQLEKNLPSIIVFNINCDVVEEIVRILNLHSKANMGFWSDDNYLLFYYNSRIKTSLSEQLNVNYETIINVILLAGENWNDFTQLNYNISRYNFSENLPQKIEKISEYLDIKDDLKFKIRNNALFAKSGDLIHFDLILKNDGYTLFEKTSLSQLLKEVD